MKVKKITAADGTVYELPQIDIAALKAQLKAELKTEIQREIREEDYTVGGMPYITRDPRNPSEILGFGTWQRVEGQFLLGASSAYPAGTTGGSATHKHATQGHSLTIAQMPSHNHTHAGMPEGSAYTWEAPYQRVAYVFTADNPYPANVPTSSVGGDQPHDHGDTTDGSSMPPYKAFYIWERVA